MRLYYDAECGIIGGGTLRADQIFPPGILKVEDIMNLVPFEDPCVLIALKGECILQALENGVSKWPSLEGRFPQISGMTMSFDPKLEPGKRCGEITIGGKPLALDQEYTMATRDFMVRGRDGYASLMLEGHGGSARSIVRNESGMLLSVIMRHYFMSLNALEKWKRGDVQMKHRWDEIREGMNAVQPVREASASPGISPMISAIVHEQEQIHLSLDRQDSLANRTQHQMDADMQEIQEQERHLAVMRKTARKWLRLSKKKQGPSMVEQEGENPDALGMKGICPKVEGRIVIVDS